MVSWLQSLPKCIKTCCSAWVALWNATTLGIHGDKGNTFILEPLSEPTINQNALKQPQIPDDTFINNETSSGFSISGRQISQLEYTLSKENMICS